MTETQLVEKFRTLTNGFDRNKSERVAELVSCLEDCDSLAGLSRLLALNKGDRA